MKTPLCQPIREQFSAYLDGAVSGVEMTTIAAHLDACRYCSAEFMAWREIQAALSSLGTANVQGYARMQSQLRVALAAEREQGTHLPLPSRWLQAWEATIAPLAYRAAGALALAVIILGGLSWIAAVPITVEANDDNLAHLTAPRYLYSQVPPQPINTAADAPILVDAKVDGQGRVYDFDIIAGSADQALRTRIEENLLASVFKPATIFGEPVSGHVMLTYAGISVRG